jgi:hypothetical protein
MRYFILVCAFVSIAVSQATASAVCNENGAIITLADTTVLYLGKNCDAARGDGSTGFWFNSASFLAVHIDDYAYRVTDEVSCLPFCESPL